MSIGIHIFNTNSKKLYIMSFHFDLRAADFERQFATAQLNTSLFSHEEHLRLIH
jgi:hypothetical protein